MRWSAGLFAIVFVSACTTTPMGGDAVIGAGAPLGSLTLSGPTFGSQPLAPSSCVSGERQLFLGFDLHDDKAEVVTRLVIDPLSGPVIRVFATAAPFDKTVVFHRADCRVLHFSLDFTGWRINRVDQLKVSLELDCRLPSGESIVGNAADSRCL